jgi:hypothetical protein
MKKYVTFLFSLLVIIMLAIACGRNMTPTEVAKAFAGALMKGDTRTTKRLLSKKALKKYEEVERQKGEAIDKLLQENLSLTSPEKCHNEKIEGERATVECDSAFGSLSVPLLKEDGAWKIQPRFADGD